MTLARRVATGGPRHFHGGRGKSAAGGRFRHWCRNRHDGGAAIVGTIGSTWHEGLQQTQWPGIRTSVPPAAGTERLAKGLRRRCL